MATRIVITGAPASGKSEFVQRLKRRPDFSDFLFFDELARQLLSQNPDIRHDWMGFHLEIYRRQTEREQLAAGQSFVTDRGTLDAFAFHPEAMSAVGTTVEREYKRYDSVIHLGSAALLGGEFYRNDIVRRETIDEALEIERVIAHVWSGHPGYQFLPARSDYEAKFTEFLSTIMAATGRPALDNHSTTASL
jgi:predicted ATPase